MPLCPKCRELVRSVEDVRSGAVSYLSFKDGKPHACPVILAK